MEDVFQRFHYQDSTGEWGIETYQDVSQYLKINKRLNIENSLARSHITKDRVMGSHKASIPEVIWRKWQLDWQKYTGNAQPPKANDESWKKFLKLKLKDPDNRYFRVDGRKD